MEWAQYSTGTSTPLLEDVYSTLPHLETRWLQSLRAYLAQIHANLQLDKTGVAPLERQGDEFIMDRIIASGKFSNAKIKQLNYCRMYLGALTISDLSTATGDYLDNAKLDGEL